jgi:hypothetical protein
MRGVFGDDRIGVLEYEYRITMFNLSGVLRCMAPPRSKEMLG